MSQRRGVPLRPDFAAYYARERFEQVRAFHRGVAAMALPKVRDQ
jgi:hypothetical protein